MKVLCISGKRGSGKSLLAEFLQINHGFLRLSLANPLKEMCKREYGLTDDQVYGSLKESPTHYRRTDGSFFTPRDIMIREGCLKRSIDPNFWLNKLHQEILLWSNHISNCTDKFVIDDIRFTNEINYLTNTFDARCIRIEREAKRNVFKAALDDLSECELDNHTFWDYLLPANKNRTPNDLKKFAGNIVKSLGV